MSVDSATTGKRRSKTKTEDRESYMPWLRTQNEIYFFYPSAGPPSSQNLFYKKRLPGYIIRSKLSQSRINKLTGNWRNDWLWKKEKENEDNTVGSADSRVTTRGTVVSFKGSRKKRKLNEVQIKRE